LPICFVHGLGSCVKPSFLEDGTAIKEACRRDIPRESDQAPVIEPLAPFVGDEVFLILTSVKGLRPQAPATAAHKAMRRSQRLSSHTCLHGSGPGQRPIRGCTRIPLGSRRRRLQTPRSPPRARDRRWPRDTATPRARALHFVPNTIRQSVGRLSIAYAMTVLPHPRAPSPTAGAT